MRDERAPSLHDPLIFENVRSAVRRVIRGFGRRVHAGDADDLIQETMLRALGRTFRQGDDPVPYVVGIARHVLADLFRRRTRESLCPDPWEELAEGKLGADFGDGPPLQWQPLWELISDWLDRQGPEIRPVLDRRLVEGDSRRVALSGSDVSCRTLRTAESRLRRYLLGEIQRSDPELAASLHRNPGKAPASSEGIRRALRSTER